MALDDNSGGLIRLDPETGRVDSKEELTYGFFWTLAVGFGSVWAPDYGHGELLRLEEKAVTGAAT